MYLRSFQLCLHSFLSMFIPAYVLSNLQLNPGLWLNRFNTHPTTSSVSDLKEQKKHFIVAPLESYQEVYELKVAVFDSDTNASQTFDSIFGQDTNNAGYDKLKQQNELLSKELSNLRARVKYLTTQCTCPDQTPCDYGGRSYKYGAVFRGGDCERCSCLENGEVQCRFDDSIPGCKDECVGNPCYNGGTCSQGSNGYYCICPPNCTGSRCEIKDTHVCFLPFDKGTACDTAFPDVVYYFEPTADDCVTAEYLGCGGNSNRYSSYVACKASCMTGTCCVRTLLRKDILYGHSLTGYDRYGYKNGYNEQGESATVQTAASFGSLRFRFQGVDYKGYRSDGYNKNRYARSGYNCKGVDSNSLNEDGLSTGFNYSCSVVSKAQCMLNNDGSSLRTEVTSFTVGAVECVQDKCHNSTMCRGCRYNGQHYDYEEVFSNGCHRCMCTCFGSVQCTCSQVTKRKEVRDMTAGEIADYQRAVRKLYSKGEWTKYSEMYERHLPHSHSTGLNFLAWHRAMLSQLEMELQSVSGSCTLTIPYFDWTLDVGAMVDSPIWRAGLFGGNGDGNTSCVEHHPFTDVHRWSPCLRRVFNSSVALPDAVAVERIKRTSDFSSLSNQLTSASFLFRLWVGGHAETRNMIYDPVVVSHYAFIDKLWHEWQQREDNYINLKSFTRYRPLEPFGLSLDDVNSSPLQLCVDYAPLNSLCIADSTTAGRSYNLAKPEAFSTDGYDSAGFDRLGYNRQGYNGDGFDKDGYDIFGYDRYGFNREGISKLGVSKTGEITSSFDSSVLDKQNYTRLGIDIRGLDFGGRDIFGYDTRGFDSDGCNGHFNDGYHYVKQKFELDLELSTLEDNELNRISRLCSDLSFPRPWIFISSWVIVDPTHRLRGNSLAFAVPNQVPEVNLWVPDGPDSRFCVELKLYSSCDLGEKVRHDRCTGLDLCVNATCPSYGTEAICRTVGCDNSCRKQWYHNGMVVTSSCIGCKEAGSGITYKEGETWLAIDGCSRCQCVAGVSKCSGCPTPTCSHPDVSGCCPTCVGCGYEGKLYSNRAVFTSDSNPCDHCQCRDGSVTCVTRRCPSLDDCREPLTLAGACCAICLSCGARSNGERWNEDACTSCECIDGRVKCSSIDCGPDRCSHPVSIPGVCCPQCNACSYQGSYYNDGQLFSPDGCQSCVCNRGNIACKPASCPPIDCSDVYTLPGECCPQCRDGCDYSGKHYDNGDVFSPSFNPCMNCSCTDHKVRCGNVYCPPSPHLDCSRPIALPGDCCPSFCPSCVFEGQDYGHGNRWRPASRPCEQCICYNGVVSCRTSRRCDKTCSYGVYAQGECCSECTDCDVDGEIHKDGSSFAHATDDGCSECVCRGGNVQCSMPTKSCPSSDCVKPIQIPDTCCPRCPQCDNGRSHGERWRNEVNQCEICECRDELVACYKQPCPDLSAGCVTPVTLAGECCPTCMDCVDESDRLVVNGTTFNSSTDACSQCTCMNQDISCSKKECPQLWCNTPVALPGQCCGTCTGCQTADGSVLDNGERFVPEDDPCSACVCQEGAIECKKAPCPPLQCNTPVDIAGRCCPTCGECATISGLIYQNGENFTSEEDICSQCNCTDGAISCKRKSCPATSCEDPVLLPNKCCPVCVTRQCDYNGTKLADGESVEVGCKQCKCEGGRVICSTNVCSLISCLHPVMGECCPTCTDCLYDGQLLKSGSHATYPDTCTNCTCQNGTVTCVLQTCPDVNCDFPTQNGCCSSCSDGCSYGGVEYEQGESFVSASNPCENCTCIDGSLSCEVTVCSLPDNCPSTYKPEGECCEICSGCLRPADSFASSASGPSSPVRSRRSFRSRRSSDVMIADGDFYYDESDCTNCTCSMGSVTCLPIGTCPIPPCLHPRTDGCCPSCSGCSYANSTLEPGDVLPRWDNPSCEECMCNYGTMDCYQLCQPTSCLGRTTIDECGCEICDDEPLCTLQSNSSVTYKSGETWLDKGNCPCVCVDGESVCEGCQLNLQCPYTETHPGSCCGYRCKGCSVNQIHYINGATWSQDGCRQTCTCHAGIVTCIENLSTDDKCVITPLECHGKSLSRGTTCCGLPSTSPCTCQGPAGPLTIGEAFKPNITDTCAVCTCVQGAAADITYLECYEPVCPDVSTCPSEQLYYPDADSCCQLCREELPYECTEEKKGEIVEPLYATCEQCLCSNNTWTCSPRTCPDIYCPPSERLTRPGDCCPSCAGCYTDVVRQAHGTSWQHDTDPCVTCKCSYGDVICERTVVCPPLFCTQGRKPFTPVGECCEACGDPVTGDDCLDSRGSTRPHGSGWPIDDCTLCECLFGKVNCTVELCPRLDCKSDETLVIEEGVCCPTCVKQPALCKVYGDPHYKTFDGETIHFQGFCSYEMVKDCVSDTFNIIAIHDDRSTRSVSWIKGVVIVAGGLSIRLGQGLWSEVNGVNVTFPFQHQSGLFIRQQLTSLQVYSDSIGFKFTWDGAAYGEVEADTKLKNKLCGLCGNFNDNSKDELIQRDGTLVTSHSKFGDSWKVEGAECSAVTSDVNPCDTVGYEVKKRAIEECAIIQGEVFAPCHRAVAPEDYVFACVYDMCACNSSSDCLCDVLTAYSAACINSYVRIQWRTHDRCALNCDAKQGLLFDECGPKCPRTCDNFNKPLGELGEECLKPCEPSCQCPAGLVLHNNRCITTDLCP